MIQRIQSVYLFISVLALAAMFFLPMYTAELGGSSLRVNLSTAELVTGETVVESKDHIYVPIAATVAMIVCLATIFMFNNRPLQMKIARLGMLLNTVVLVLLLFLAIDGARTMEMAVKLSDNNEVLGRYEIGAFLPILGMVFCFLASRAIMKDEAKVRSANRLR